MGDLTLVFMTSMIHLPENPLSRIDIFLLYTNLIDTSSDE